MENVESKGENIEFADNGFDDSLDLDLDGFDLSLGADLDGFEESQWIAPALDRGIPQRLIRYDNAAKLANDIEIKRGMRTFVIVSGNFIFGDFIEALFAEKQIKAKRLSISTLSLNQNNADSLANIAHGGFVDRIDLIISAWFYAHERHKKGLIPYLYATVGKDGFAFDLAVSGSHTKIAVIETEAGNWLTIHGSANLRSSGCTEQIVIEEGEDLAKFCLAVHDKTLEVFSTSRKPLRAAKQWEAING